MSGEPITINETGVAVCKNPKCNRWGPCAYVTMELLDGPVDLILCEICMMKLAIKALEIRLESDK